jgi:hypothetical protein
MAEKEALSDRCVLNLNNNLSETELPLHQFLLVNSSFGRNLKPCG